MEITISQELWAKTPAEIQAIVLNLFDHLQKSLEKLNSLAHESTQLGLTNKSAFLITLAQISRERPRQNREIVFISNTPTSRQAKLAFGLKEIGWKVILFHKNPPSFDPSRYFEKCYQYDSPLHASILACSFAPVAFHVFESWDFSIARTLIELNPGPIVFDSYDLFAGGLQDNLAQTYAKQVEDERFCLENASGVCTRHIFLSHAKHKLGYRFKKVIFFPEYCWDDPTLYGKPRVEKHKNGIHCTYVGSITPQYFDTPEGKVSVTDREFIRSLTDRKIHYHIHPFTTISDDNEFRTHFAPYITESENNPYFHFHPMMSYEKLLPIVSRYHFGLASISEGVLLNGDYTYKPIMHRRGTHNKTFDYLDAELVMVTYAWDVPARLARGACISAERSVVGESLAHITPADFEQMYRDKITPVRRRLAVWRHSNRLAKFYSSL